MLRRRTQKCSGIYTHARTPLTRTNSHELHQVGPGHPARSGSVWGTRPLAPSATAPLGRPALRTRASPRPGPLPPRHVTRHAPAARGLHQNKNREGRPAGLAAGSARGRRARPRCRCRASAAPSAAEAARPDRPGAGGQRAPPCLQPSLRAGGPARKRSPGKGPWCAHPPAARTSALAWEARAAARNKAASPRSRGPGPARVSAPPQRAAHGCFVSAPVTTLLRTSPPSSRLRRFRRPSSRGRLLPAPRTPRRSGCGPSRTSGPRAAPTPGRGYIARLGPPPPPHTHHLPPQEGG